MIPALAILFFSAMGATALFLRHVPVVSAMTPEELAGALQQNKPLLSNMWDSILRSVRMIWSRHLREKIFSFLVKKVSWVRIFVLRMEQTLLRFTRRMRDTTSKTQKQPSEYWKEIHGWHKTTHWSKKKGE
jgi:hypothetical protein